MRIEYGRTGEGPALHRFLTLARAAAVVVSVIMVIFGIEPPFGPAPVSIVLASLVLYNFAAGLYALSAWLQRGRRLSALVAADLIVTSVVVGITGAYNSPYFAMFLFTMAETALYFGWRAGAAAIVSLNGVLLVATVIEMTALGNPELFSPIESRFLLLMIVGLLFVVLAETMRRQERARRSADRASVQAANLNAIYAQMGQAHLQLERVFAAVFEAAQSLDGVLFCAILRRSRPEPTWTVVATSQPHSCPIGTSLGNEVLRIGDAGESPRPYVTSGAAMEVMIPDAARSGCGQLLVCAMPSFSQTEEGMLVAGRRNRGPLESDDETFFQALAMQAQLAIHNALLYDERARQLERLERFKRMQDTFFSAAAHELKTPLTVLGVLSSTLRMTVPHPSPQQIEMFTTIEQNIRRLQAHTENLLAAARLETDDIVLKPRRVDPKRIAARVIETMRMIFEDRAVSIDVEPDAPWPKVLVDPDRLAEIFSNLLSNAAKFAPANSRILVSCRRSTGRARFSVCDDGPGIPPKERRRVFEKAYTGEAAGSRAGTGLGLYIVRELIHLHRGRIWIDAGSSSTCFHFTVPLSAQEEGGDDE